MKNNDNKRTVWTAFLKEPTEQDIQLAANEMVSGKGHLFVDSEGMKVMYPHRRLNEYEAKGKTFIRRIAANDI